MGPIFTKSIKEQFTRQRDGDSLWYKSRCTSKEIQNFPSLSDVIKTVSNGDMTNFLSDVLTASVTSNAGTELHEGSCTLQSMNSFSLLDEKYEGTWNIARSKKRFDISLTLHEPMKGAGYIGIGWGCQKMSCAEFWFCSVNNSNFIQKGLADSCDESSKPNYEPISCFVSTGASYVKPTCAFEGDDIFYPLNIKKSCFTSTTTSLNIQVSVCKKKDSTPSKCFDLYGMAEDENIDYIAAHDTIDGNRPHGPLGRTSGAISLSTGSAASSRNSSTGVFGVHGAFMLFAWMFCAPLGIFIVRYKKTESYRLAAHISLMAFVWSLMLPLIIAADKSVENSSKSVHGFIGKAILPFVYDSNHRSLFK